MGTSVVVFPATGDIQTYIVPVTGGYLIEACGAEAPIPDHPCAKGDRVKGLFYLNRGDLLKVIVGSQEATDSPCQRLMCSEGGSIVWRGAGESPLPARLLLAANGGRREPGERTEAEHWAGSFNAGAFQSNARFVHIGDGSVSIVSISPAPIEPGARLAPVPARQRQEAAAPAV